MPADNETITHLKKWYKTARSSGLVLNFALALGKKDEGMMIFVDKRKKPTKLLLDAKDEGETNKFAFGTMRVQKDQVFLTCLKKPPAGTAKLVKRYLKLIKMPGAPSSVVLTSDDGATYEADSETQEAPQAENPGNKAPTSDADPLKKKFEAALKLLEPKAAVRIKAGGPIADRLKQAMKLVRVLAEKGDFQKAMSALGKVQQLIKTPDPQPKAETAQPIPEAPPPPKADPGPAKEFAARRAQVLPMLAAALKQNSPHVAPAQKALKEAMEKAKGKDFRAGLAQLDQVSEILAQPVPEAEAAPQPDPEPEAEAGPSEAALALKERIVTAAKSIQASQLPEAETTRLTKALTKARKVLKDGREETCETLLNMIDQALDAPPPPKLPEGREVAQRARNVWDHANKDLNGKIGSLRREFAAIDDPNFEALADKGLTAFTGGLYVRLNKSLLELQMAKPDKVLAACEQADDAFGDFRSFLDQHEAVQLIDQNPFDVSVNMRGTLGDALKKMQDIVRKPAVATR